MSQPKNKDSTGSVLVLVPDMARYKNETRCRNPSARAEEAAGLARAIDLEVTETLVIPVTQPRPATLFGTGKVDEIAAFVKEQEIDLVFVDSALTPGQQRNLEKAWETKVIDRTGLILEIFGERARTREGTLQVELAHLTYQKSRLVRSWTHLERQRGGFGFLGGPGETQIEADRRMITERIVKIKRELEQVTRTRKLHRKARERVPFPVVALVGYTNAGKSTLFNALSGAKVQAEDLLFATLDPTLRAIRLPTNTKIIISDTVGFISDLPTQLIAAFRATLEEVIEADVILHVRDIAHEDTEHQARDVEDILRSLDIDPDSRDHIVEVWNKADLLAPDALEVMVNRAKRDEKHPVIISALTGQGLQELLEAVETKISRTSIEMQVAVCPSDGEKRAWFHRNTQVLEEIHQKDGEILLRLRVEPTKAERIRLMSKEMRQ